VDPVRRGSQRHPVAAQRVVGTRRHDRRQLGPLAPDGFGHVPEGLRTLLADPEHAHRRGIERVADRDGVDAGGLAAGEVVQAHLGQVDHQPLAGRLGQHVPGGQPHPRSRLRGPDLDARIEPDHGLEPDAVAVRQVDQRVLRPHPGVDRDAEDGRQPGRLHRAQRIGRARPGGQQQRPRQCGRAQRGRREPARARIT
jgi:hypothetical protein